MTNVKEIDRRRGEGRRPRAATTLVPVNGAGRKNSFIDGGEVKGTSPRRTVPAADLRQIFAGP
jgi:hypothetical protein